MPWGALRLSCLVASAAASGYFWRGALEQPDSAQRFFPPEAIAREPAQDGVPGPGCRRS